MTMLQVVALPRAGGKTTALLEWAKLEPGPAIRYLVCESADRARDLFHMAQASGESIRFPLTFQEALDYRGAQAEFAVDNADMILQEMLHGQVAVMAVTVGDNGFLPVRRRGPLADLLETTHKPW